MKDLVINGKRPWIIENLGDSLETSSYEVVTGLGLYMNGGWRCYSKGYGHPNIIDIVFSKNTSVKKFGTGSLKLTLKAYGQNPSPPPNYIGGKYVQDSEDGFNSDHLPFARVGKYLPFDFNESFSKNISVGGWFKIVGSNIKYINFVLRAVKADTEKLWYATVRYDHSNGAFKYLVEDDSLSKTQGSFSANPIFTKQLNLDEWYCFGFRINSKGQNETDVEYFDFFVQNLAGQSYWQPSSLKAKEISNTGSNRYARLAKFQISIYANQDPCPNDMTLYLNSFFAGWDGNIAEGTPENLWQ